MQRPGGLAAVAREALRACHYDPETGDELAEEADDCAAACYRCLLTYSNQRDHRTIDRRSVRDLLLSLARSTFVQQPQEAYDAQYERLWRSCDVDMERRFLEYLRGHRLRLPDDAQNRPAHDVNVQPDFYYERDGAPGVCVFVDGAVHAEADQATRDTDLREQLRDRGFGVLVIRYDQDIGEQVRARPDLFVRT